MNEQLINEIADRLKRDILSNKAFVTSLLKEIKLGKDNIKPELILEIMAMNASYKQAPVPKTNLKISPLKDEETTCRKPISIGVNSQEAKIISDILAGNNVYLYGKAGTGKAQPMTSKILCESGWKTFADIKVGDKVWGQDGKLYSIDGVYDRGTRSVYKVIANDGGVTETCDEHLWKIYTRSDRGRKRKGEIVALKDFMGKIKTKNGYANAFIDVAMGVDFPEQHHIVAPYLMGVLLGDGSISTKSVSITNPSQELFDSIVLPDNTEFSDRRNNDDRCLTYGIRHTKHGQQSVVTVELNRLELLGKKSVEKHIPKEYLFDSFKNRVALLQGLNDTDAYSDESIFEFSTSSKQMADDYAELVRGLGGTARITSRIPKYTYGGMKLEGHISHRIFCVFPDNIQPFSLSSKLDRYRKPTKYFTKRFIDSVEYKGEEQVRCISVTNPEHLYITDDYIVTHNTYLAEAIAECVLQQPVFIIACSQWTSPIDIKGGQTITGYKEGQLIEAWAKGGIIILDELPKLDPNTAGLLNQALAETSAQPRYDESGNIIPTTIPFITNGRGEKIYKGQSAKDNDGNYKENAFRFGVVATGNTDMKTVANQYSGNQKQDYSLVDRFAGSYYEIKEDTTKEISLTYSYVFSVSEAIRTFINGQTDMIESISLRTMLNFNRTYEQFMLNEIESPYADKIYDNEGNLVTPKSFTNSLDSFISTLPPAKREALLVNAIYLEAKSKTPTNIQFKIEFMKKYGKDPITKADVSYEQVQEYIATGKYKKK